MLPGSGWGGAVRATHRLFYPNFMWSMVVQKGLGMAESHLCTWGDVSRGFLM